MTDLLVIPAVYTLIGVTLTASSPSRGPFADAIFVVTWPVHVVLHLLGKDRP